MVYVRWRPVRMEVLRVADVAAATDGPRAGEFQADASRAGELRIDGFRAAGLQGFAVDELRACERPGGSRQRAAMVSSAPGWGSTGRRRKPVQRRRWKSRIDASLAQPFSLRGRQQRRTKKIGRFIRNSEKKISLRTS